MNVLIIGCRGQDGRWLSEIFSTRGYNVFGVHRSTLSSLQDSTEEDQYRSFHLTQEFCVDFSRNQTATNYLNKIQPKLIFHLAAVHESAINMKDFGPNNLQEMQNCHVKITYNVLEWIKDNSKSTRLAVALTSQMYSSDTEPLIISEDSITLPQNIYGETKLESFKLIQHYRNKKRVYASGLILFNHTSVYAKPNFLFKVLAKQIYEYSKRLRSQIIISNADYKIDICDAREVCEAMRLSIESDFPKDYVISSGELNSIRSIVKDAGKLLNLRIEDRDIVSISNIPQKNILLGNPNRILKDLGWRSLISPAHTLASMVENEFRL